MKALLFLLSLLFFLHSSLIFIHSTHSLTYFSLPFCLFLPFSLSPSFPTSISSTISHQDQDGNTLLHLAVDSDEFELVEWCLHLGFSTTMHNNTGMNSLHIAARRGNYDITSRLLQVERVGEENMAQFVNSRNKFRSTPLYSAAKFGNAKVVELLLDK